MDKFRPGKFWYDDEGKRIHAHGGSIMYVDGTYYWYGENKEGVFGNAFPDKVKPAIWHNGVKVYSSKDLYNWHDEGIVIISDDPANPFYPRNIMDRPHILYNKKTNKYVMWAKCVTRCLKEGADFESAKYYISLADKITGPYTYSHVIEGITAGDFDLFIENGKGYYLGAEVHSMHARELNDEFTGFTGNHSVHIEKERPPFVREAPCYFVHEGRRFIITSGTSGYFANPTLTHELKGLHGEYVELGETCVGDYEKTSFRAQFSSVFKHPFKKDLYIALGDRWLNDLPYIMEVSGEDMFEGYFNPNGYSFQENLLDVYSDQNTSEATYVWLPIRFDKDGKPYIEWASEWKVEDFD